MVRTGGPTEVQTSPGVNGSSYAQCVDVTEKTEEQKHDTPTDHENTTRQPGAEPVTVDDESQSSADPAPVKKKKVWPKKYNKGPFICAYCSKIFRGLLDLTRHERTHTNEKPLVCEECGRGFSNESSLRFHMDVHRDHRPFSCPTCKATFRHRYSLNAHMVVHTDLKPFACEVCGIKMRQKSSMRKHLRIHTGERPYKCEICGRAFSVLAACRLHQQRHADPNSRVNRTPVEHRPRRRSRSKKCTANLDRRQTNCETSPVKPTGVAAGALANGCATVDSSASNPAGRPILINCNDIVTFTFTPLMVVQTPFGKKTGTNPLFMKI